MDPIQEKLIVLETLLKQLTSMKASPDIISAVLSEIDRLKNGGNLWSLLCSTGVLFLPPGGCQFAHSTLPVDNRLKHVILFRTVCYTDTNTYSQQHLSRNQFNNLHNISTKPDQAVVIIGVTKTDTLECTPGWILLHNVQHFQQRDTLSLITTLSVKHWLWTNGRLSIP